MKKATATQILFDLRAIAFSLFRRFSGDFVSVMQTTKDLMGLVLFVSDILGLGGIKGKIADGGYQTVNTKGDHGQENVATRSGGVALGFERGMVDYDASDPSEKKGEKKTNQLVVIHNSTSLSDKDFSFDFESQFPFAHRKYEFRLLFHILYSNIEYLSILNL